VILGSSICGRDDGSRREFPHRRKARDCRRAQKLNSCEVNRVAAAPVPPCEVENVPSDCACAEIARVSG